MSTPPDLVFPAPEPERSRTTIHPVFLPFAGCPVRCVFCEQASQTGHSARQARPAEDEVTAVLDRIADGHAFPGEIAFYGGTFTLLPEPLQSRLLALADQGRKAGLVTGVRASTRPDAVTPAILDRLRGCGMTTLELGVQSFHDHPLAASSRNYSGRAAVDACRQVTAYGLGLVIQLMPGMPGLAVRLFQADMDRALTLRPQAIRLYPCLVLKNTVLADLYGRGEYSPWSLEETVHSLVAAQLAAWKTGVRIIRMGLAPQKELLEDSLLGGPWHPALGSLVRGRALMAYVLENLKAPSPSIVRLAVPRRYQGEFWGHLGSLKPLYAEAGLDPKVVRWHDLPYFAAWSGGNFPPEPG